PPPPPPPPSNDRAEEPLPTPKPPPGPPIVPFVAVGVVGSVALAPGPTLGADAGVGLRRHAFSLQLEGRVDTMLESESLSARDRVTTSVYSGALVPCGQFAVVTVCLGARLGSLHGTGLDVSRPALKASLFGAGFARIGVRLPLGRLFALRAAFEGGMPFVRTTFVIDGQPLWTAPAVFASTLIGVEWQSP
ncbi:MAG TPA: hypothetical protein VM925_03690, partial [Labilithrix sp.]|nr:hypothetical protein [Labilithrix sp.]